jgi:catechol 2,3-dioxygenase-like lactoylglutathione lyase family enzyme
MMDLKLELVVLPVGDVDRAKAFYERLGFTVDVDHQAGEEFRVVQCTPPGSSCSISFGKGISAQTPGSVQGLHLVVADLERAIAALAERGIAVGAPFHFGPSGREEGLHPERADYASFADLQDPDGNGWLLQDVPSRAG